VLILSHLLFATPFSERVRISLTLTTFAGALLDAVGPWAVRYVAADFSYLLLFGWMLLGGGSLLIVLVTLAAMWAPERWLTRLTPQQPATGDE
jgi:hypothetical protein